MNHTTKSVRSGSSSDHTSRRSFRVIVKDRTTHQNVQPTHQKSRSQIINLRSSLQNFQQAKHNLKKYIRQMKATSKMGNYDQKQNTNRSLNSKNERQSRIINSGRAELSSRKLNKSKGFMSKLLHPVHNRQSIRESIDESYKQEPEPKQQAHQDPSQLIDENSRYRFVNQSKEQGMSGRLPILRSALQNYEEPHSRTFYSYHNDDINHSIHNQHINYKHNQKINYKQNSSRQRLTELQSKIEDLLQEKLRIISTTDQFSSKDLQNHTAFKLLEKQMDRLLLQIRRIKENQTSLNRTTIELDLIEKDQQINKTIQVLQKKVKILERLIGQKLFESDNLKNQYLMKIKQHKRNKTQIHNKNSFSSTFYRQANQLQLSNFKPNKYEKSAICANDPTTNKADFKTPMKSYYISANKNNSYNSNTLTQPLPRSTYKCQYLKYGVLPNDLIRVKSTQRDHRIFNNGMSPDKQKHMLEGSTYKQEFITLKNTERVNFKQLDAYKDKFRSIQVNYGKERNIQKINNSNSAMDYYEDTINTNKHPKNNITHTQNPQAALPLLNNSSSKKLNLRVKLQQLARPMHQTLNQTEKRMSMIEQQALQKHNLFHQRIKSEIKHKNVYDQKYKFKNELIKQKIRNYVQTSSLNKKIDAHETLAY